MDKRFWFCLDRWRHIPFLDQELEATEQVAETVTNCQGIQRFSQTAVFNRFNPFRRKSMALVDSESAFKKRCEQLQPGLAEKAEAQNLTLFSTLDHRSSL